MSKVFYIIISGKQGAGKTTLGDTLTDILQREQLAVYHTRFAKVIYKIHDNVRNIMRSLDFIVADQKDGDLLQYLGTDWGRKKFGDNVWVKAAEKDVKHYFESVMSVPKIAVISDCRFENEAEYFDNSLKIRLNASEEVRKPRCEYWRDNTDHLSETSLDKYEGFHLVFDTGHESTKHICDAILYELRAQGVL